MAIDFIIFDSKTFSVEQCSNAGNYPILGCKQSTNEFAYLRLKDGRRQQKNVGKDRTLIWGVKLQEINAHNLLKIMKQNAKPYLN